MHQLMAQALAPVVLLTQSQMKVPPLQMDANQYFAMQANTKLKMVYVPIATLGLTSRYPVLVQSMLAERVMLANTTKTVALFQLLLV